MTAGAAELRDSRGTSPLRAEGAQTFPQDQTRVERPGPPSHSSVCERSCRQEHGISDVGG
jgi:hypothetical protein